LTLDDRPVAAINSRIESAQEEDAPQRLSQSFRASSGTSLLGEGFILEPEDRDELLQKDPDSKRVIKRFVNGEDIVRTTDAMPTRYVIDFGTMELEEAQAFVGAFRRVDELVRPQRTVLTRQIHEHRFWLHWDKRFDLYESIASLERVIAFPLVTKYVVFTMIPYRRDVIFSHKVGVVPTDAFATFCVLQSSSHVEWVTKYSSSRGETINYSISDCLTPFPFPENFETDQRLEAAGKEYYEFRAALMVRNNEGLTRTYNRFHDPEESSPDILKLRELHAAMDGAVLDAYGWADIPTDCQFQLDYVEDDENEPSDGAMSGGKGRKKRKPNRYRWADAIRDEVLARLLALNAKQAELERLSGAVAANEGKAGKGARRKLGKQRTRSENVTGTSGRQSLLGQREVES
jgi:hypothetical protein